jgi:zinc D-Ala-D-Ala carboxypeptidase
LNSHVGGAGKSQHLTGQAADIQCPALGNEELLRRIVALELPFDQLINEFGYQWVHVSYDPTRGRAMVLEAVKGQSGATEYKPMTV